MLDSEDQIKVVISTTKVMNFEQITTVNVYNTVDMCCHFYHKGNEFWANHNLIARIKKDGYVVISTTKVMNFEQITTKRFGL